MSALALLLALQGTRVTLELRDVPLLEAADRALWAFGHLSDWIREPLASRRVNLTLRDAGYLETLDTLSELAGQGPLERPDHPILNRGAWSPDSREPFLLEDLGLDLRMIGSRGPDDSIELVLVGTRGPREGDLSFMGRLGTRELRVDLQLQGNSRPRVWKGRASGPFTEHPGETALIGELRGLYSWPVPIRGTVPFPPRPRAPEPLPESPEPPSTPLSLWAFLVSGLGAGGSLIALGIRRLYLSASR